MRQVGSLNYFISCLKLIKEYLYSFRMYITYRCGVYDTANIYKLRFFRNELIELEMWGDLIGFLSFLHRLEFVVALVHK